MPNRAVLPHDNANLRGLPPTDSSHTVYDVLLSSQSELKLMIVRYLSIMLNLVISIINQTKVEITGSGPVRS